MRLSNNILRVVANPFAAPLNPSGAACALAAADPAEPHVSEFICARVALATPVQRPGNPFGPKAKAGVIYSMTPTGVPDTNYYRGLIASGDVFAVSATDPTLHDRKLDAAARAAFHESELSLDMVCVAWKAQGLASFADLISAYATRKRGPETPALAPVSDPADVPHSDLTDEKEGVS